MDVTKAAKSNTGRLPAIPKLLQVGGNRNIQLRRFGLLFAQCRGETLHLFPERFAVILGGFRADVATGGEHVAVLANLIERRAFAEASYVAVFTPISVFPRRGGRG